MLSYLWGLSKATTVANIMLNLRFKYVLNYFLSFYSFTYLIEYCNYFEKPEFGK